MVPFEFVEHCIHKRGPYVHIVVKAAGNKETMLRIVSQRIDTLAMAHELGGLLASVAAVEHNNECSII